MAHELVRQHKVFTKEWVRQHYKTLTPLVFSAAETFMQKCKNVIDARYYLQPVYVYDLPKSRSYTSA